MPDTSRLTRQARWWHRHAPIKSRGDLYRELLDRDDGRPTESYREFFAREARKPWLLKRTLMPNYTLVALCLLLTSRIVEIVGGWL